MNNLYGPIFILVRSLTVLESDLPEICSFKCIPLSPTSQFETLS